MGIHATYHGSQLISNAYIRIDRIWGSKKEGWNAWVGVYRSSNDKDSINTFHVGVPYVEGNPFKLLYDKVHLMPFLTSSVNHGEEVEVTAPIKKGGRKKKSDA